MTWAALFTFTNVVAFAGWAMLALLPRGPKVMALVLYMGVGLLCLTYAAIILGVHTGLWDPARLPGAPTANILDYNIPGLRVLFMSDAGIVLGWTHYLAFDLFVGQWIARDADNKGFSRLAQIPVLFLTLMAGPVGLLVWLAIRERRARAAARRG